MNPDLYYANSRLVVGYPAQPEASNQQLPPAYSQGNQFASSPMSVSNNCSTNRQEPAPLPPPMYRPSGTMGTSPQAVSQVQYMSNEQQFMAYSAPPSAAAQQKQFGVMRGGSSAPQTFVTPMYDVPGPTVSYSWFGYNAEMPQGSIPVHAGQTIRTAGGTLYSILPNGMSMQVAPFPQQQMPLPQTQLMPWSSNIQQPGSFGMSQSTTNMQNVGQPGEYRGDVTFAFDDDENYFNVLSEDRSKLLVIPREYIERTEGADEYLKQKRGKNSSHLAFRFRLCKLHGSGCNQGSRCVFIHSRHTRDTSLHITETDVHFNPAVTGRGGNHPTLPPGRQFKVWDPKRGGNLPIVADSSCVLKTQASLAIYYGTPGAMPRPQLCSHFGHACCARGDQCRFIHLLGPPKEAPHHSGRAKR